MRTDASGVTVAVIDTGMQLDHPDLVANLWTNPGEIAANGIDDDLNGFVDDVHGWDFVNNDAIPNDDNGHGTHVSGTIGARGNNGVGVTGVAWSVQLMPLKAFDAGGNGNVSSIIAALDYAASNGARISNNSYGGTDFNRSEYDAFVAAGAAGLLAVAAAGNDAVNDDEVPHYPAAYRLDSIVSVAATTSLDELASFSNFGTLNVQVAAPGLSILSTLPGGSYGLLSGTSMATPNVTGVAALVAAEHPAWTGTEIRDRILGTTRDVAALLGKTWTGGVIDAGAALSNVPTVLPPPTPTPTPQPLTTTIEADPAPAPAAAPPAPTFPSPEVFESSPVDGLAPQIALDANEIPSIAYTRRYDGVHLLTRDGGSWADRQLTQAYDDYVWLDLAMDGADVPTVAVQRFWSRLDAYSDPGIVVVQPGSPGPTEDRVTAACPDADTCYMDWNPSLAFDGAGVAHATFVRTDPWLQDAVPAPAGSTTGVDGPGTYYATKAAGAWTVRRLTTDSTDGPAAMAVEDDGTVHAVMSRRNGSSSGLYYLTNDGGTWTSLQLTDHVEDFWASIGVDSSGGVHVGFTRPGIGLYYLHRSPAGVWDAPQLVYDGIAVELHLAVDDAGHAHVAFGLADGFNSAAGVAYATNKTGPWVVSPVAGGQGHQPDLAVDAAGHAHIAYSQATGAALGIYYATNTTGSFVSTLAQVHSSEVGQAGVAYAVDSAGHQHVAIGSHYGEASVGLYYGTDGTGSWVFSRLTTSFPDAVSLTLDGADHPHIAFIEGQRLDYATDAGGTWQVQHASPGMDVSADGIGIALDAALQPEIVYANSAETKLLRARRVGTSWTTDTIYSGATSIRQPSVTMDPSGVLHLAVIATLPGDIGARVIYVRGTTGSWSSTSITPGDTWRVYPSLSRATDGTIWIADWQIDHGIWVHQRPLSGSWVSTHLTSLAGDSFPGLAIDAADVVHVVYANGSFYGSSGCTVPECADGPGVRHAALVDGTWETTKLTPYWHDGNLALARGGDESLSLVFSRLDMGLRALELIPGKPTAALGLQPVSDTGANSGDGMTSAPTLVYDVTFDRAVNGLAAVDFSRSGTATGCTISSPSGSAATYSVAVTGCSAGTVVLALAANAVTDGDGAMGPAGAAKAPTVTIDRTRPTVTAPASTLRIGVALTGTSVPARLAWTGSDGGGSGIVGYEVDRSLNGSTTWTRVSSSIGTPAVSLTMVSTGTVRFRVRAVDRAGNVGSWVNGPLLTPRLIQQTSAALNYLGTWTTSTSASYSGGSAKAASAAGARATYGFSGRSIAIVTTKSSTRGRYKVYIDGAYVATIDTYAKPTAYRVLTYQKTWSSDGTHAIRIIVVGTSGRPRIDLDALVVVK